MTRLLVHVEGQTEETFVNEILAPHLYGCGYSKVSARLVGNARQRDRRGGIRGWSTVRDDILIHLKEDTGCVATTMVDYYGLPQVGAKAWPGRAAAGSLPFVKKAITVQDALLADIRAGLGNKFHPTRFVPYVMMHEFEGLLFSDCGRFGRGIGRPDLIGRFQQIRDAFNDPEEINDSPNTAPSKRVEVLVPGYQKPFLGALAAVEIGLDAIRAECPYFRKWLESLESVVDG
ncbi:MAG: DUF4276 family protein [Deltaproteobacteria bacterium]|nr:DUF4276 family protein [Deltaproteobacteria bacterium]